MYSYRNISLFQPNEGPYAFIEFYEHASAAAAKAAMNKRMCVGRVSSCGKSGLPSFYIGRGCEDFPA